MVAKQVARIPLGVGGVDAKSDGKHVPVGKWDYLQNVELRADGSIRKRRALDITGGGSLATLVGGGRRIAAGGSAGANGAGGLASVGSSKVIPASNCPVTSRRIVYAQRNYEYPSTDVCVYDGHLYCAALEYDVGASSYDVRLLAIDPETGDAQYGEAMLFDGLPVSGDPKPRLLAIPDHGVMLCYHDVSAGAIKGRLYYGGQWRSTLTLEATAHTTGSFDVCVDSTGDAMYLVAARTGILGVVRGWTITGSTYNITLNALASSQTFATASAQLTASICVDEANGYVAACSTLQSSGHGTNCHVLPDDLTSISSVSLGTAAPGLYVNNGIVLSAGGEVTCLFPELGTAADKVVVRSVDLATASITDDTHTLYCCGLIHRPAMESLGGLMHFGVARSFDDIETVSVTMAFNPGSVNSRPYPVATYGYGNTVDYNDYPYNKVSSAAPWPTATGTRWYWGSASRNVLRQESGAHFVQSNLSACVYGFDLSTEPRWNHAHAHDSLVVAGGLPTALVGNRAHPAGFAEGPVVYSATGATSGSGSMTASTTHLVKVVFEFMDEKGRVWQSAPSAATSVTLGGSHDSIDVQVYRPVWFDPTGDMQTAHVAVYMTEDASTIYYRASPYTDTVSALGSSFTDGETTTVSVDDSDATISARETLYTDSGELRHDPAPPLTCVVQHKNRLWGVHAETGDLWASLEFRRGEGVHWSLTLTVQNPDPAQLPTAIVGTDSALVVFYRNRIGFVYGDGPNNQGLGPPFSPVQFLPDADVGAVSQKAVAKVPQGIFFLDADKGFHVMPYGGGPPQYVGRDVDGAPDAIVVGTAHLPDRHEVRIGFYDEVSVTTDVAPFTAGWLTWHYDRGAWSYGKAADHTAANTHATADGNTFIFDGVAEKAGRGYDGFSTYVATAVVSGWISLVEATRKQGLFRLWNLHTFCNAVDEHALAVVWYYNYDPSDSTLHSLTHSSERLKIYPAKQLLESFKLLIADGAAGGTTTAEGFELSDIELLYGVYPGVKPRVGGADVVA